MRRLLAGAAAICIAAALWGLDGVVLTPRLNSLPVPFVVFLLHLIPFLVMQLFLSSCYFKLKTLPPRDWLTLCLVALSGGIVGTFAIVKALFLVDFNQLSVVVLLQKLQPVFAIWLAAVLLKEPVSKRFIGWAGVAIGGAYLLTFGLQLPQLATGGQTAYGALWATIAAAAYGSATVFGKRILSSLDFREATFGRYGLTVVLAGLYLLVSGTGFPFDLVDRQEWLIVLLIGLTTGSGAIFLYYFGLTRVPATVSAICELCLPMTAILLDYWINDSVLQPGQWLGALLLIWAILQVTNLASKTASTASA